jgi:hypothetical protein
VGGGSFGEHTDETVPMMPSISEMVVAMRGKNEELTIGAAVASLPPPPTPSVTAAPGAAKANPSVLAAHAEELASAGGWVVSAISEATPAESRSLASRAAMARSSVSRASGGTGLPFGRDGDDGKSAGKPPRALPVSTHTAPRLALPPPPPPPPPLELLPWPPPCVGESAEPRKLVGEAAADRRMKLLLLPGELADAAAARAVSRATCDAMALGGVVVLVVKAGACESPAAAAVPASHPGRVGGRLPQLAAASGGAPRAATSRSGECVMGPALPPTPVPSLEPLGGARSSAASSGSGAPTGSIGVDDEHTPAAAK